MVIVLSSIPGPPTSSELTHVLCPDLSYRKYFPFSDHGMDFRNGHGLEGNKGFFLCLARRKKAFIMSYDVVDKGKKGWAIIEKNKGHYCI